MPLSTPPCKSFASLQAAMAIQGWTCEIEDSDAGQQFIVSRWGHSRTVSSLAELEQLARVVGAIGLEGRPSV